MSPYYVAEWAACLVACAFSLFCVYVLGLFAYRLTRNYIDTLKPEPTELFPVTNPNAQANGQLVGPIQRPPGMGPAPLPPMWPNQR